MERESRENQLTQVHLEPFYRHEKIVPMPGVFWSKSNFLKIIYARDKIFLSPGSLGIYRRIYLAAAVCNIPAAPDISGTWRLSG